MKTCGTCKSELSIDAFGVNRANSDGRNIYCKDCVRTTRAAARARLIEFKRRNDHLLPPKPPVIAVGTPLTRVRAAIKLGAHTREEIKKETKLGWDELCDALAILNCDHRSIRCERVNGDARFYAVKVA